MRRRITVVAAATALLAVLLLALPLGVFVNHGYVNDERLELQRAAATAAASLRGDSLAVGSVRIDRSETVVGVYDRAGRLIDGRGPASAGPLVRTALLGVEATGTLGADVAVAAPVSDGDQVVAAVLVQSDLRSAHHRGLIAWFVISGSGLAAVLLSAGAALLVARRLSAPVEQLRTGARLIGEGDLDARVALSGVPEFDSLARTLNDSTARIQTMVARERSLSAEISHQLRTPLSGLRLQLEALDDPADPDARIDSALSAVDQLEATITDIIALARDLPSQQVTHLHDLFRSVQGRWHSPLAAATRPLRVIIEPDAPTDIALSTPAATQILDVLIDNALQHGLGAVTVRARNLGGLAAMDVSDEGPALTQRAHELFQSRDPELRSGIGLPFARKLAETERARVTLTAQDPPTFTLVAPAAPPATRAGERVTVE